MKLLKIHVENFGKLSDFTYDFHDGINLIKEPNGFGKSTLAAFIKAMLYGFPARGGRSIASNERKKYLPWQGGAYGGYLQFSAEGIQYRVTRYFGKTAAGDSFQLEDETNRMPSRRFSEHLGEELFQLDAASFARSTYMPQRIDTEHGATLSIRARLSNLVDNTDDFHNYEDARERLRAKRSALLNYRGDGGRLKLLQEEELRLERALAEAEQKREPLRSVSEEISRFLSERKQKTDELGKLREEIRMASAQKAKAALYRQLDNLKQEYTSQKDGLRRLDEAYPNGYPALEEINEQRRSIYHMTQADKALSALTAAEADLQCKAAGDALFGQPEKTKRVLNEAKEQCSQLRELERLLLLQKLTPEEQSRQDSLTAEFSGSVPTEAALRDREAVIERMERLQYQRDACMLSAEKQQELSKLERFFSGKKLTEETIAQAEQEQQRLERLRDEMQHDEMEPAEKTEWKQLSHVFAEEVPEEAEIKEKQRVLRRIEVLEEKRGAAARQMEAYAAQPENEQRAQSRTNSGNQRNRKTGYLTPVVLGITGVLLLCLGILGFWKTNFIIAVIPTALGVCVLIGASFLLMKRRINRSEEKPYSARTVLSEKASEYERQDESFRAEEMRELSQLKRELSAFMLRFYDSSQQPADQLLQLLIDRKRYAALWQRKTERQKRAKERAREIAALETRIDGLFQQFYPGEHYRVGFIRELDEARKQEAALRQEEAVCAEKRAAYSRELAQLSNVLKETWETYHLEALSAQPRSAMQQLRDDVRAWRELGKKADMLLARRNELRSEIAKRCAALNKCLELYRLEAPSEAEITAAQKQGALAQCYEARFDALQESAAAYQAACGRLSGLMQKRTEALREREAAKNALAAFLNKYGLGDSADITGAGAESEENLSSRLEQMAEDCYLHQEYLAAMQKSDRAYQSFLKEHPELHSSAACGFAAGEEEQTGEKRQHVPELDVLLEKEKDLQALLDDADRRLNEKRQERERLLRELEKAAGLEEQLREVKADEQEAETNRRLLDSALDYLEQAKNDLANNYVGQVEQRFAYWTKELLGELAGETVLDRDLGIRIEERGDKREVDSFSAGTADMLMICMRLALIDALFQEEKPFIILDDPFVNLDDAHTKRALELLQTLAKTHQILYLVCNSSRTAA